MHAQASDLMAKRDAAAAELTSTAGVALRASLLVKSWEHSFAGGQQLKSAVVQVSSALAYRVLQCSWHFFHVVPLKRGCRPMRMFLTEAPSMKQVGAFLHRMPEATGHAQWIPPQGSAGRVMPKPVTQNAAALGGHIPMQADPRSQ